MTDLQTLIDLNILPEHPGALSLKSKLDYCRTQGGKDCLHELLKLENITYNGIQERQSCIRFICEHPAAWKMPVSEEDIFYLKQYLGAGYVPLQVNNKVKLFFNAMQRLLLNKGHYYFVLSGVKVTLRVVQDLVSFCHAAYHPGMPGPLKRKLQALLDAAASLGIKADTYDRFQAETPELSTLFTVDHTLRTGHIRTITGMLEIYYQLEMYYSLAMAHRNMQLSFPELQEDGADIYLEELAHPLVANCHTNTIRTNGRHMIIITGPNMSGKSTFMKSVGTAFVMAALGIGVAAKAAVMPVMDIIVTCIDIKDDIEKGYSYFFSEVKKIRSIAEKVRSGKRVLVIGDELFKGTNVQDALDCTRMVLEGLLPHRQHFYFIATHFPEIAARFETEKGCYAVCFDGAVMQDEIKFDYRLKPGISTLRIGSLILKQQEVLTLLQPAGETI